MGLSDLWHAFQGGAQAVGNFVHDVRTDFTGGETVAEQQQDQRAQQATQQDNAQRAQLEAQARGMHVSGYDPPFIQQRVRLGTRGSYRGTGVSEL